MAASIARKTGKVIGIIVAILVVFILALVAFLTVTEYNPPATQEIEIHGVARETLEPGQSVSVVTWNAGYGGLSKQADFFMDGGDGVRTVSHDGVLANLAGIEDELAALDSDFIFLQEVDQDSERTYGINERARIATAFAPAYASAYALNYDVAYVPYPLPPIGAVESGIMTLSRMQPSSAERVQLPCPFSWPVRLGNLKRCLLVERVPVQGGTAELVLVNLHLEAYDDGEGKAAQTAQLARLLQEERARGNYVIAGGDYNHDMIGVSGEVYGNAAQAVESWAKPYDFDGVPEGFTVAAKAKLDETGTAAFPDAATCRDAGRPYDGTNDRWVMDTFICSDNVECLDCSTVDLDFAYSDHNPVAMTFKLR